MKKNQINKLKLRLSEYLAPLKYKLTLKPDLEKFVFEGREEIILNILKPCKEITLHAKELIISGVRLEIKNKTFKASKIKYNKTQETVTFSFKEALPKGQGSLFLDFKGELNDKMRGFYRSQYNHKGQTKHLATTQFEATDARRAFPCFDEPEQKAVFEVKLIIPKGKTAVSNTIPVAVAEHSAGYEILEFAPTPKMSTYLLAFIIGDLEYLEDKTKSGIKVRVFTTEGKKHQAKFALSCALKALDFYEHYFAIKYPLPVLDMIAIPDFASAAMENWGAITYRETALLVDEQHSTASTKQWVAIVVAHEIAHMWFGNLVTMQWWTHLWLNEGFASYMEYKCVDFMFPEWKMWEQYVSGRFAIALRLDSLNSTHPIEVEVHHPQEISEIFDEVSYAKGSSVIRMLAEYLGEKVFRDGLRLYLKTHAFKNTRTEDLWKALEKVSKKPVTKIMQAWVKQPGYPLVKVIEQPKFLKLEQSRFFSSKISRQTLKNKTIWQIPFSYNSKNYLLENKTLQIVKSKQPCKLNLGETSLFRVDYPSQMLFAFKQQILNKSFGPVDRLALVRDAFALAESGQLPTSQALELLTAYKNEDNLVVWEEISSNLVRLNNLTHSSVKINNLLKKFIADLFLPISEKLTFSELKSESQNTKMLRSLVFNMLALSEHKPTIAKAEQIYKRNIHISANIRSAVYNLNAKLNNKTFHKSLVEKYISEEMHEEKERIGRALAHFTDPALLKLTLEFSFSKHVRSQDAPFIIASVWSNPFGRECAWEFFKAKFAEFEKRYDAGLGLVARILKVAGVFTEKSKAEDIKKFFKKHPIKAAKRTIEQALEKIHSNVAWLSSDLESIENWLVKNFK